MYNSPGVRSPWRLNSVRWHIIIIAHASCFPSNAWKLEMAPRCVENFCTPANYRTFVERHIVTWSRNWSQVGDLRCWYNFCLSMWYDTVYRGRTLPTFRWNLLHSCLIFCTPKDGGSVLTEKKVKSHFIGLLQHCGRSAYCVLTLNEFPHSSPEAPRIIQMRETSTSVGGNYYQWILLADP